MVARAEIEAEQSPSDDSRRALMDARKKLHDVLLQEEIFWRQKSRVRWLKEGERNTRFFHTIVNVRRRIRRVEKVRDANGEWVHGIEGVAMEAARFFAELFSTQGVRNDEDLLDFIPRVVTDDDNVALLHIPSKEEVKKAVFALSKDSAPGLDGFFGYFFISCWEIIGEDVWRAVEDFFSGGWLPRGYTSANLVLIPKKENPESAFVQGRFTHDNIALVQEVVYDINRNTRGGNVVLKLDMAKAYDRLEWGFLFAVLERFGFAAEWIELIKRTVENCWFSVVLNGGPAGFFKSSRGVDGAHNLNIDLRVRDVWNEDGTWDQGELQKIDDQQIQDCLQSKKIFLSEIDDRLVWMQERTGVFSSKSAWRAIRQANVERAFAKWIWH
ncbi:uncharacterized protein LOC122638906 [Telopea speciosissima]|uniref:uncharacterized protein LOC122638906 n=1 Tax=Telopea speciosissima TaxID=54955 RepID=UPI001CC78AA4|nr:uncharacterized protein LOC122638906 [Telopea speciosissima]